MERNRDQQDGYTYDVVIKGFDTTFWKQTAGTSTVSSNKLRSSAASLASYIQHGFADVEFALNVPTTPSGSEAKHWGLRAPATDDGGAAYFEIAGAVFRCITKGNYGVSETTNLTWSAYENVETKFRIVCDPDQVKFMINGVVVATHSTQIPCVALPLRIVNADADNVDLGYVMVRRAASVV